MSVSFPRFLAPVLAAFYRAHPKVTFNIVIASASATLDALCSGEADLGLAFYLQERADVEVTAQCELAPGAGQCRTPFCPARRR